MAMAYRRILNLGIILQGVGRRTENTVLAETKLAARTREARLTNDSCILWSGVELIANCRSNGLLYMLSISELNLFIRNALENRTTGRQPSRTESP